MTVEETTLATIEAIYEAGLEPTRWPKALNSLAKLTRSQAATFWVLGGGRESELSEFTYINFDSAFIREYLNRMTHEDPTVQFLLSHPNASVIHDAQYLSERDIDSHHYYDWHLRHTDARYRLSGQMRPSPELQAGVTLHRTKKAGRFNAADLTLFNCVYPHLQRSLIISFRLGTLAAGYRAMVDLLDRERVAMLLLDSRGHLIHHNAKLEALVQANDGLRLNGGGLLIDAPGCDQHLAHLIAMAHPNQTRRRMGGFLQVPRPSGKRPFQVFITPIPDRQAELTVSPPAVCIAIIDPDDNLTNALSRIKTVFGLTTAEARLASLLASGEDLRVAGERLGIQYGTARARLADIYQKTETHRQGELICLLLTTLMTH